jgi:hypothetical protein
LAEVIGFPPAYKLLNHRGQVLRHCLHMMAKATEISQQQDTCAVSMLSPYTLYLRI